MERRCEEFRGVEVDDRRKPCLSYFRNVEGTEIVGLKKGTAICLEKKTALRAYLL